MAATKYYRVPFAETGDTSPVPDAAPGDGSISYESGFGPDYQKNLETDPNAKAVPRTPFNEVMKDITTNIQQYQQHGVPNFITTADNGGSPYSYDKYARVLYDLGTGSGVQVFISLVDSNTADPSNTSNWKLDDQTDINWDENHTYSANDIVNYNAFLMRSLANGNTGNVPNPGTQTAWWQPYLQDIVLLGNPQCNTQPIGENNNRVANTAYVYQYTGNMVGVIVDYIANTNPDGWLIANGGNVSRVSYPNLFNKSIVVDDNATFTSGSPIVTGLTFTTGLTIGQEVTSPNLAGAKSVISSIDSATQITLADNAGTTGTAPITYYEWGAGDGSTTFGVPDLDSDLKTGWKKWIKF